MTFILEDKTTHRRILSLYNPYNYTIKYRVLSTAPEKYIVSAPEGSISAHFRADIVIRHNDIKASNCDIVDKFRIQMQDKVNRQVIGRQDVTAILKSSIDISNVVAERENFQAIPSSHNPSVQTAILPSGHSHQDIITTSPNYVVLTIAMVCIGGLFLPTEHENSSNSRFQVSVGLKLIFSYVLGLVTMVILKP
ncbi:hypothetical protein PGB90_001972 [Kerria lacca]